jgi:hypothetical protein
MFVLALARIIRITKIRSRDRYIGTRLGLQAINFQKISIASTIPYQVGFESQLNVMIIIFVHIADKRYMRFYRATIFKTNELASTRPRESYLAIEINYPYLSKWSIRKRRGLVLPVVCVVSLTKRFPLIWLDKPTLLIYLKSTEACS